MTRHAGLSIALFLGWLALNQSASPGHLVLGIAIAVVVPFVVERMLPGATVPLHRPGVVLRLAARLAVDIVQANFALARRVLGSEARLRSRFVWVPLQLTSPQAIAVLATIVSLTPGTVSCDVSEDRSHLLVHVFDLDDEATLLATIRQRYEEPLREIFRC